jgi:glycosyltransferase involved in cell wall biosynthesis
VSAALRILYFAVHDADYPRNRRVRGYLERWGHRVTRVAKPSERGLSRWTAGIRLLVRESAGNDVVIVSEFALAFVPVAWIVTRLRGQRLVVDGFVSLYETHVEDWGRYSRASLRGRLYRAVDGLAIRLADLYLVDTELRADGVRSTGRRGRGTVLSLPVGAPEWARPQPAPSRKGCLRVLYYGNYIPLHGLDLVVDALGEASAEVPIVATFIGDGEGRAGVESRVRLRGLDAVCVFEPPVPEGELRDAIARHDLTLGVFGTSTKARSVIANKVWQGLACGRPVITRESEALDEIRSIVGDQLTTVGTDGPGELARALVAASGRSDPVRPAAAELESYVEGRFALFESWLSVRTREAR